MSSRFFQSDLESTFPSSQLHQRRLGPPSRLPTISRPRPAARWLAWLTIATVFALIVGTLAYWLNA
ncbi:MAG TPA: hypothetical protein VFV25_05475 [Methylibium sp.]